MNKLLVLAGIATTFIGWLLWLGLQPVPVAQAVTTCYQVSPAQVVADTNIQRNLGGLSTLILNTKLNQVATLKANDMVANHYWAHVSPTGITPWYWYAQAGYHYAYAGENLAEGITNTPEVTTSWMNSPEHKANILNQNYTEVGIAIVCGLTDKQTTLVVAEYGSPK